jgi:oligopeptide transport system substrate-binding protein
MADSIEPDDEFKTYTVKLKDGWTFHDGTPVKAESFVKAWNYYAYSPNGMANGTFFADIAGYDQTWADDPDAEGPQKAPTPPAKEMSGLKVVDDTTFTVELSAPSNLWPVKVGYAVFMPMPDVFFEKGPEEFAKNPIGNGPFKYKTRTVNTSLTVEKYADYKGREKPKVDEVVFKVYEDDTAAYADVQTGNLDFQQQVPTEALTGDKYKTDFGDRAINKPVAVSQNIAFPMYKPEFKNPKVRQAISMAIDRELIVDKIFNKSRVPMNGWVNPNVSGYEDGACGDFCKYDPAKAKALLAEGGGFTGSLSIAYNADAAHKAWVEATCNSIKGALGINCVGKPIPTFDEFRTLSEARKHTSLYRAGWQADYPSIENWLNPLVRTGASSNDGNYSNAAVDAKLKEADGEKDLKKAEALYRDAEKLLADDMPSIPLWHVGQQSVYSDKVDNVVIDAFGELSLADITVK